MRGGGGSSVSVFKDRMPTLHLYLVAFLFFDLINSGIAILEISLHWMTTRQPFWTSGFIEDEDLRLYDVV
jgi:hypothetical protein